MAVQVARRLGAGEVIAAGRDADRLESLSALGADRLVRLTADADATAEALGSTAAEVDIVIDYLWGEPAKHAMVALLTRRADRSRALDWIQIGAVAGPELALPSVALRSANLRLQGVGQGSVSGGGYVAELPSLVEEIAAGTLAVATRTVPLADVEEVWTQPEAPGVRMVVLP
jgi:NADPH:quinone reductase-like Zn-dependent oxidoreductase